MKKGHKDKQKILTLNDLGKFTDDVLVPKIRKATREDFMEFTDEVLLPAIENIVDKEIKEIDEKLDKKLDEKFAKQTYNIKDYIDKKMDEVKSDIISFIKGDQERDRNWKRKVVNILTRKKLTTAGEIKILSALIC